MERQKNSLNDFLNPHQQRSLFFTLYQLEQSFREAEEWLKGRKVEGILYSQRLSLSKADRLAARQVIRKGLELIADFAESLNFEKYNEDMSATISALMNLQWINLHDQHAAKHKRSGEVHSELAKHLDPRIDELIAKTLRLAEIIRHK